jgi:hypothetical protein
VLRSLASIVLTILLTFVGLMTVGVEVITIVSILGIMSLGIDRSPNGTIVVVLGFGICAKVIDRMS